MLSQDGDGSNESECEIIFFQGARSYQTLANEIAHPSLVVHRPCAGAQLPNRITAKNPAIACSSWINLGSAQTLKRVCAYQGQD